MKKSSDAKTVSNRANAQKSTGPKTDQGKANSKGNALKHGIYAVAAVLKGEDAKLYNSIKAEQNKRFRPKTFIEEALVTQLIGELWTLRRIMRAEYWFASDIQSRMRAPGGSIFEVPISSREKKIAELSQSDPESLEAALEEAKNLQASTRERGEFNKSERKSLAIFEAHGQLEERVERIPDVYLDLFLYSSQDRMQKLIWLRRHSLQTILTLERELGVRMKLRAKSKNVKVKSDQSSAS